MAWPNSQNRAVELTVQSSQVSGSGTHSAFPVLITRTNLPNEMCSPTDANRAQSDGGDIRAGSDADGTTLFPLEVVSFEYDSTDGAGDAQVEIWVKRDLGTSSNTSIWLGYNTDTTTSQPSVTDPNGRNAVWTGAAYQAVYHMTSTTSVTDSTGNGNDLSETSTGGTQMSLGSIGALSAVEFAGDSGAECFISGTVATDLQSISTIQYWGRLDSTAGSDFDRYAFGIEDGSDQFSTAFDTSQRPFLFTSGGNTQGNATAVTLGAAELLHFVFNQTDNNARVYQDGSQTYADTAYTDDSSTTDAVIRAGGDSGRNTETRLDGALAECRLVYEELSANWISTEYNNQDSPGTFISVGTPQSVGGGQTFDESLTIMGAGSLSNSATLTINAAMSASASAGMTQGGTSTFNTSGSLSASAGFTPSASAVLSVLASLAGTGTLSPSTQAILSPNLSLSASSTITAAASSAISSAVALAGSGALSSSSGLAFSEGTTISGSASLSQSEDLVIASAVNLTETADLAGTEGLTINPASSLATSSDLTVLTSSGVINLATDVTASGLLSAQESMTFDINAALSSVSALGVGAQTVIDEDAGLSASVSLSADGTLNISGTLALGESAGLATLEDLEIDGVLEFSATADMSVLGTLTITEAAQLAATGALSSSLSVISGGAIIGRTSLFGTKDGTTSLIGSFDTRAELRGKKNTRTGITGRVKR